MARDHRTGSHMVPYKCYPGRRGCCTLFLCIFVFILLGVYVTYFRRPPTEELLRMNSKLSKMEDLEAEFSVLENSRKDKNDNFDILGLEENSSENGDSIKRDTSEKKPNDNVVKKQIRARAVWQKFLKDHNYVSIGEVYTSCDKSKRMMVGQVLLLPDPKYGGVMARTHMNFTTPYNVTGGEFFIDVKYNDKDLYDNHWDLCELAHDEEDEEDQRLVACPLAKGFHSFVQDRNIPYYLPKGKYETRIRITDQTEEEFLCGKCVFML